jgi:hypothetical protein
LKGDGDDAGLHDDVDPVILGTRRVVVEAQIIKKNVCASCNNRRNRCRPRVCSEMPLVLVLAEADGRRAVHPTSQI